MPSRLDEIDRSGDVAVVTGGAQGIGETTCETFAALGADVAIADVQTEEAAATADEIQAAAGNTTIAVETDVSDYDSVTNMVETVVDELGSIDVLVNNAAVGNRMRFLETDADYWESRVGVIFMGTLHCMHAALPHMIEQDDGGAIINFASDSYKGNDPGLAVYGAAKAANVSLTRTIAHEHGKDGVRVNCVSPGATRTPATADSLDENADTMIDRYYALDRLGERQDIANAVAFLASDAAGWITGETVSVNGGYVKG